MIVVLGIDGLEYDAVVEFDLKYVKQEAFTMTNLEDFSVIATPPIWGAMLTGEVDEEAIARFERQFPGKDSPMLEQLNRIFPPKLWSELGKAYRSLYDKVFGNPMHQTEEYIIKKGKNTIFDEFDKSWHNNIPSLGRQLYVKDSGRKFEEALESWEGTKKFLTEYAELLEREKAKLFEALDEDYELVWFYTSYWDRVGHLVSGTKVLWMNEYLNLNKFVKKVKQKLSGDDLLYIVSDHGFKPHGKLRLGEHSDHGFFSSSTGKLIKKPQDMFSLLKNKVIRRNERWE